MWANKLLAELRDHQAYFDTQPSDLQSALEDMGVDTADGMEFALVLLDDLDQEDDIIARLNEDSCFSQCLCNIGFAVVERTTCVPIVINMVADVQ